MAVTSTDSTEAATTGRHTSLRRPESLPALLVTLVGVAVILGYWRLIRFATLVSDAKSYWSDSTHWLQPVNQYHLPAYPWMLAFARGLTGGAVAPTVVMTVITVGALLAGVHATYELAQEADLSRRVSLAAASAFGLWPFVGVVYAAFPVSDPVAVAALLWGTLFLLRRRVIPSGLALGLAATTHKALWPTIGLLILGQFLVADRRRAGITIGAIASTPLLALWIDGVVAYQPPGWLLTASKEDATRPVLQSVHVLDGLLGSAVFGDWMARDRLIVVMGILVLAAVLLTMHVRRWREPLHLVFAVFAGQIVFMGLTLNQSLIWASVRFSGLLAVPAAWAISPAIDRCETRRWRYVSGLVGVSLLATQVLSAAARSRRIWGSIL